MKENVLVLIDDRAGREDITKILNVSLSDLVGLLLLAKEKGALEKIRPVLDELICPRILAFG